MAAGSGIIDPGTRTIFLICEDGDLSDLQKRIKGLELKSTLFRRILPNLTNEQASSHSSMISELANILQFRQGGVPLYTMSATRPWEQVSQRIMLFDRSPATFEAVVAQEVAGNDSVVGAEEDNGPSALQLFVSGDRSQVGKSSICLGLLGALVRHGFPPSSLAYIKPATQCEAEQPVAVWCRRAGIACVGVGPIVFYPGFTREFLKGSVGTSADLLAEAVAAVHRVSRGRRLVVVDGVGYPAVGSICGVSNADVAAALGAAVLLVGRPGVGDAVDSFNLNTCFFESRSITVLGGVFNRLKLDGFYSLASCREAVTAYFAQRRPQQMPYGFVPDIGASKAPTAAAAPAGGAAPPPSAAASAPVTAARSELGDVADGRGRSRWKVPGPDDDWTGHIRSEQELSQALAAAGQDRQLVVLEFGASWCGNCTRVEPFMRRTAREHRGRLLLLTADVDVADDLAETWNVTAVPSFVLFAAGRKVAEHTGSSEQKLTELIASKLQAVRGNASAAAMEASGNAGEAAAAAADAGVSSSEPAAPSVDTDGLALAEALIDAVATHVDVARLVRDLEQLSASAAVPTSSLSPPPPPPSEESGQGAASGTSALPRRRNRKEIEADAAAQGATIGTCGVRRGGA